MRRLVFLLLNVLCAGIGWILYDLRLVGYPGITDYVLRNLPYSTGH